MRRFSCACLSTLCLAAVATAGPEETSRDEKGKCPQKVVRVAGARPVDVKLGEVSREATREATRAKNAKGFEIDSSDTHVYSMKAVDEVVAVDLVVSKERAGIIFVTVRNDGGLALKITRIEKVEGKPPLAARVVATMPVELKVDEEDGAPLVEIETDGVREDASLELRLETVRGTTFTLRLVASIVRE